jgi:hypothetical protein
MYPTHAIPHTSVESTSSWYGIRIQCQQQGNAGAGEFEPVRPIKAAVADDGGKGGQGSNADQGRGAEFP